MPGEVVDVELVQNRQKPGFCRPQYRLTKTESDFFFYFKVFPEIANKESDMSDFLCSH